VPSDPSDTNLEKVRTYYDRTVAQEWGRLDRHRTEFAVTMRAVTDALATHLPAPRPLRVLDAGGGPGRYSLALAEAGHEVTLLDLSPANVEHAREVSRGRLAGYHCGSATDLAAFADETFHAVLLLGPLYHLLEETERLRAVSEALRVLVPGGLLFAAFINVFAPIRDSAKYSPTEAPLFHPTPDALLAWMADGRWRAGPASPFTDAWFVHPAAVAPFMEKAGEGALETLSLLAAEGVVSFIEEKLNELEGPVWDYWVEVNYRLAGDPSILGAAEHLLYVGRRRPNGSGG